MQELGFKFLIFLNHLLKGLYAPAVQLEAQHLFESWILIEEHVVSSLVCISIVLLVNVVLNVNVIFLLLKGKSLDHSLFAVEDDAFVDWTRAHDVFHTSYYFKAIFVQLPRGSYGGEAEFVLDVVLEQEGTGNVDEVELELVL